MLTVERKKKTSITITFADIPIGTVYEDVQGGICIKASDTYALLCDTQGEWHPSSEALSMPVIPLKAKLVIEE